MDEATGEVAHGRRRRQAALRGGAPSRGGACGWRARRPSASGRCRRATRSAVARIAGIQAAKRTSELIPLCHPLPLTVVEVTFDVDGDGVAIEAAAETTAQTGVEMEALTAVAVAGLTVYDMAKAIDKEMRIDEIVLVSKSKDPA